MTDLLLPPAQDVIPHVDTPIKPNVPASVIDKPIQDQPSEALVPLLTTDAAVQPFTGERSRKPITDVRVGRAILLAASLKERKKHGQPIRNRAPVI